jgi:LysR family transcriptional activator of nhaA
MIAYRILQPVLVMPEPVQLICEEGSTQQLISELAEHRLDVVLADEQIPPLAHRRAFNHLLGSSGVTVFGSPKLAARYKGTFPACLNGAPFLLPIEGSKLRQSFDQWLDASAVRPVIVGEFRDSALLKTFGAAGTGFFLAASAIEAEVRSHYDVKAIGRIDSVRENFYAISFERRLKHPAVLTLCEAARDTLFST